MRPLARFPGLSGGTNHFDAVHVRPQNLRDHHAAVSLLIVFKQGNQCARHAESGSVKRMHELWPAALLWTEADTGAPGLKVRAVGGTGNLFRTRRTSTQDLLSVASQLASTINIASRMEEAAKAHGVACAISGDVAQALSGAAAPFRPPFCC